METRQDTELLSKGKVDTGKMKPKVIRRSGKRNSDVVDRVATTREHTGSYMEEPMPEAPALGTISMEGLEETPAVPEPAEPTPTTTSPPPLPPLPGFFLDGASRNQSYVIRNMLVFADCCVAHTEDEVFDVIARNYSDTGGVCWWLYRIGKPKIVPRLKGKDIVDAARIVAHALHRQLKKEVGLRIPRW
jgi:hypothetical protein